MTEVVVLAPCETCGCDTRQVVLHEGQDALSIACTVCGAVSIRSISSTGLRRTEEVQER